MELEVHMISNTENPFRPVFVGLMFHARLSLEEMSRHQLGNDTTVFEPNIQIIRGTVVPGCRPKFLEVWPYNTSKGD